MKEKAEAHLYTIIKVARDDDLVAQIGKDIFFDLVDHDKVKSFQIHKLMPFVNFKEEVAKEFGIPVQFQRFWLWAMRQNHTYRPDRPLTMHEESQTVGQLEVGKKGHNAELKLFLEVELGPELNPLPPPERSKEDILLFFKLYDPEKEQLRYVGRLFVKSSGKPADIVPKLNKMAGFPVKEEIDLYEEISFKPTVICVNVDKRLLFHSSELGDGDIVCYQRTPKADTIERYCYPDVPSYLEYICNRRVVHFHSLEKPKDDDFSLEMSKMFTYDDVVERVARQLGVDDPSKIRLTSQCSFSQHPKPQPIKYRGVKHLSEMLVHDNQTHELYYEVLEIPLPELQGLKTLKVAFRHSAKDEASIHSVRLPRNSTVGDMLNDLRSKAELSHPNAELRLLEVFHHKINKIFGPNEKIENIHDQYWTLCAEEIPEEEKNLGPRDRLIRVYHFYKDTKNLMQVQNFGEPFLLVIHEGETLYEVKARIQKKLQIPDEIFAKWKFAYLSLNRPEYLQDTDIVSSKFQIREPFGAWEQYLGLEHPEADEVAIKTVVRLKEAEMRACNAEEKLSEFEVSLKKAEMRAHNAEEKLSEFEAKLKESEMRAHNAEEKMSEFEVKLKESEMRAHNAEEKMSEFVVRLKESETVVRLKEAEMRACNAEEKLSKFEVRLKKAEMRAHNAEEKLSEFEVKLKESEMRACSAEKKLSEFEIRALKAEVKAYTCEVKLMEARAQKAEAELSVAEQKGSKLEKELMEAETRFKESQNLTTFGRFSNHTQIT